MKHRTVAVIPCLNAADFLDGLLNSIVHYYDPDLVGIVAVDNGSTDDFDGVFDRYFSRFWDDHRCFLTRIKNAANLGFAPAVNQGIEDAFQDPTITSIAVFNADQRVKPRWLDWLLRAFDTYPRLGCATSRLIEGWGVEQFDETEFPECRPGAALSLAARSKGSPWLWRRETLEEIGLLDEQFLWAQSEDSDWLVRAALADWEFAIVNNSVCYHHVGSRGQQMARAQVGYDFAAENRDKFVKKWGVWEMDAIMPEFTPERLGRKD